MKVLIDQGLGRSVAALLTDAGHDAVHVGELGLARASDREILQRARRDARAVVTLDADFHALLAHERATTPSVIRLRVQGVGAADLASLLTRIIERSLEDLQYGAVVTSDGQRIRIRRLPIG